MLIKGMKNEFICLGLVGDVRYENSQIIVHDGTVPPKWNINDYQACAKPGHRAPCMKLRDGSLLWDKFGKEFNLLVFSDAERESVNNIENRAKAIGLPLTIVDLKEEKEVRELYAAPLAMVRPDDVVRLIFFTHFYAPGKLALILQVAWRGTKVSEEEAEKILQTVTGQ